MPCLPLLAPATLVVPMVAAFCVRSFPCAPFPDSPTDREHKIVSCLLRCGLAVLPSVTAHCFPLRRATAACCFAKGLRQPPSQPLRAQYSQTSFPFFATSSNSDISNLFALLSLLTLVSPLSTPHSSKQKNHCECLLHFFSFLGRPPNSPLRREAAAFFLLLTKPPLRPRDTAAGSFIYFSPIVWCPLRLRLLSFFPLMPFHHFYIEKSALFFLIARQK
jgi:hypothetical protein